MQVTVTYFMVQWFCHILKTIWYVNTILWDYESVWPDVWPKNKCRSLSPIFHCPVILPYIFKTILVAELYTLELWVSMTPLKIFAGHCDLHFMVHYVCLISWRLFDVWTLYFVIMSHCNAAFALKQCRTQWCFFFFSWSSDFALY